MPVAAQLPTSGQLCHVEAALTMIQQRSIVATRSSTSCAVACGGKSSSSRAGLRRAGPAAPLVAAQAFADDRYGLDLDGDGTLRRGDAELAFVIGHELAHGFLRMRRCSAAIDVRLFGGRRAPTSLVLETEREPTIRSLHAGARRLRHSPHSRLPASVCRGRGILNRLRQDHPPSRERIAAAESDDCRDSASRRPCAADPGCVAGL